LALQAEPVPGQSHHHHADEPRPQLQAQRRKRSVLGPVMGFGWHHRIRSHAACKRLLYGQCSLNRRRKSENPAQEAHMGVLDEILNSIQDSGAPGDPGTQSTPAGSQGMSPIAKALMGLFAAYAAKNVGGMGGNMQRCAITQCLICGYKLEASGSEIHERKKQNSHQEINNNGHLERGGTAFIRDERFA
jgi:hypothetical protein